MDPWAPKPFPEGQVFFYSNSLFSEHTQLRLERLTESANIRVLICDIWSFADRSESEGRVDRLNIKPRSENNVLNNSNHKSRDSLRCGSLTADGYRGHHRTKNNQKTWAPGSVSKFNILLIYLPYLWGPASRSFRSVPIDWLTITGPFRNTVESHTSLLVDEEQNENCDQFVPTGREKNKKK